MTKILIILLFIAGVVSLFFHSDDTYRLTLLLWAMPTGYGVRRAYDDIFHN